MRSVWFNVSFFSPISSMHIHFWFCHKKQRNFVSFQDGSFHRTMGDLKSTWKLQILKKWYKRDSVDVKKYSINKSVFCGIVEVSNGQMVKKNVDVGSNIWGRAFFQNLKDIYSLTRQTRSYTQVFLLFVMILSLVSVGGLARGLQTACSLGRFFSIGKTYRLVPPFEAVASAFTSNFYSDYHKNSFFFFASYDFLRILSNVWRNSIRREFDFFVQAKYTISVQTAITMKWQEST